MYNTSTVEYIFMMLHATNTRVKYRKIHFEFCS